jgi:predicted DNA-binding transcriptional regulator AlpA
MEGFFTTQKAADAEATVYSDPPFYSVSGFCKAHHIARSFFYQLLREGRAPRVTKLGRRTFVTREAAAEWRRRIEQETQQESGR